MIHLDPYSGVHSMVMAQDPEIITDAFKHVGNALKSALKGIPSVCGKIKQAIHNKRYSHLLNSAQGNPQLFSKIDAAVKNTLLQGGTQIVEDSKDYNQLFKVCKKAVYNKLNERISLISQLEKMSDCEIGEYYASGRFKEDELLATFSQNALPEAIKQKVAVYSQQQKDQKTIDNIKQKSQNIEQICQTLTTSKQAVSQTADQLLNMHDEGYVHPLQENFLAKKDYFHTRVLSTEAKIKYVQTFLDEVQKHPNLAQSALAGNQALIKIARQTCEEVNPRKFKNEMNKAQKEIVQLAVMRTMSHNFTKVVSLLNTYLKNSRDSKMRSNLDTALNDYLNGCKATEKLSVYKLNYPHHAADIQLIRDFIQERDKLQSLNDADFSDQLIILKFAYVNRAADKNLQQAFGKQNQKTFHKPSQSISVIPQTIEKTPSLKDLVHPKPKGTSSDTNQKTLSNPAEACVHQKRERRYIHTRLSSAAAA
ncbi:hypothetical protein PNK_1030 [Candidatus Protochlamydia naegleriophila]|uniref:Uncharacterized protein n=1 Tax=Candidatus Protochlamydia naegleriophila TaxID=389348 RepID=A0A0U5JCU0_9BACT|nr:hypothetical protein [Candidatus Protochlamydia naegleriophila]CUI16650.1 hypothetical protein PNK_1030 [Candidatus Protochlamydia naegleriophila]